ncbi:MAG: glycerate kinase [Alphaproteobacteria bacterium]|jgi:glycerate kinase|nr:glycerate kinase [Alphaproteobacteria bacterium]
MRILIAPDSFKGSATAPAVAAAIADGLRRVDGTVETVLLPMADGGEGTVEALIACLGGERVGCTVPDPLDRPVDAAYGWIAGERLAVIEMAAASGLPLLGDSPDPVRASTFGTGVLIRDALDRGAARILLGIGGSATVDGGTGLLAALGARFLDADGEPLRGAGGTLGRIAAIDLAGLDRRLRAVNLTIATDVTSPLLGPQGAVHVFGPQKGVAEADIPVFEAGMAQFAERVVATTGVDHRETPGAGAAGGIGFLLCSAAGAEMRAGFPLIAGLAGLDAAIAGADLVITGEGRLDAQSLAGKVPVSVARRARAAGVPAIAIAGLIEGDPQDLRSEGVSAVVPIVDRPMALKEAMAEAEPLLAGAASRFMTALQLGMALARNAAPQDRTPRPERTAPPASGPEPS